MQRIKNVPPENESVVQLTEVMTLNLPVLVSTVRLPTNHGTYEVPLWYETMVFDPDRNDLEMRRYADEAAATKGHADLVMKWLEKWVPTEHELPSGYMPQLTSGEST